MTKKVVVTGANGQLAKTIKKQYHNNTEGIEFIFLTKKDLDITNKDLVKKAFTSTKFDYCINCAAYTNVEQAEKTPEIAFEINAEGARNIALSCKQTNTTLIKELVSTRTQPTKRTFKQPKRAPPDST